MSQVTISGEMFSLVLESIPASTMNWKDIVIQIAMTNPALVAPLVATALPRNSITSAIRGVLMEKGIVAAIRLHREHTGLGLRDSKEWVEKTFPLELEEYRRKIRENNRIG